MAAPTQGLDGTENGEETDNKAAVQHQVLQQSNPTASLVQITAQLEEYEPLIPDVVTSYYLSKAGFEVMDPRLVRLVSLSTQKFITDIANDALQQFKMRQSAVNKKQRQDKKATLTMEDLSPALAEYGIVLKKPPYYT